MVLFEEVKLSGATIKFNRGEKLIRTETVCLDKICLELIANLLTANHPACQIAMRSRDLSSR
ncbi:MAG: hypothetical protein DMG55_07440 [Acidobacteria bacterium]|nr:MAG: hypothetical protein DMG55_07440 [Acidobacteriota bacterium]